MKVNLYQLETQWKQFISSLKPQRQTNSHTAPASHYVDTRKSADNPEERHRLSLNDIKDRLDEWDRQK